jgi:hypothetical protein
MVLGAPKIKTMAKSAVAAGLRPEGLMESSWDYKFTAIRATYLQELDELEKVKAEDFLSRAVQSSDQAWSAVMAGGRQAHVASTPPRADAAYQGEAADDSAELPPSESGSRSINTSHVQGQLAKLQDCTQLRKLEKELASNCLWSQLQRLKELRHKDTCHTWLFHLNPLRGSVMTEGDYVINVQKRLGAKILSDECWCNICGKHIDPCLNHSEVCAIGEATRGHYAVVRAMVDGLKIADPAVTTEPRGLTRTQDRRADIFTSAAVPGRSAALDVCIASPDSAAAGEDACESAFKRKLHHHLSVIPELHAAIIASRPMIWSADGRPHPAVTRTLKYAADIAARKRGGVTVPALLARWKHEITVAFVRRRAAMIRAVLPQIGAKQLWMMTGVCDEDGFGALGRLPQVECEQPDLRAPD